MDKINAKSVFEATEEHSDFPAGTPIISIDGDQYDIKAISAAMLRTDEERGFPVSVCLKAMQFLAAHTSKLVVKDEESEKRRKAEEARLKRQAEQIDPLIDGLFPILNLGLVAEDFCTSADVWVSFTKRQISFTLDICKNSDMTEESLALIADGLNARGIGLKAESTDDGISWKASEKKAAGTRAKGTAVLLDGLHRLNEGKALEGFTGGFVVHNGRVYVRSATKGFLYEGGKDFLTDYTVEEGKKDNPDRPWGFPSKVIASVSSFVGEDTEMYKAFVKWNTTKADAVEEGPETAEEADADNRPADGEKGQDGAGNAPVEEKGEGNETESSEKEPF